MSPAAPQPALEGVRNFRDLGGARAVGNRRVVPRRLFRSASLHEMTPADRLRLARLGVTAVVDLRSTWERRHDPYHWEGVRSIAAPLADDGVVIGLMERFRSGTMPSEELEDWWRATRVYEALEERTDSLRLIFEELIAADRAEGFLFHCRGGKDRTGLAVALVLGALGVYPDDIMADFLLSNDEGVDPRVRAEVAALFARPGGPTLSERAQASLWAVHPEWLEGVFARLAHRYGSVAGYLEGRLGIGPAGVELLRDRYLEPDD